jgi:hypothetical protein
MNLGTRINRIRTLIAAGLLCATSGAFAQHYIAGSEGIKAATLPPAGIYFRDYNFFYYADSIPNLPSYASFEMFSYINAPRLLWMTDWQIFGADYGMDVIVPFGYARAETEISGRFGSMRFEADRFGLGDIQIEPLLLSWHTKQFDFTFGYAVWAPTGDFDVTQLNIGKGFWTHMLTAGATWYLDQEKTWAASWLNRYEISHEQEETGVTPGHVLTMEWGISKTVCQGLDLGVVGYWQQQVTDTTMGSFSSDSLSRVVALGPEVSGVIPKINVIASVRYLREFAAKDRPEGNTVTLTFTKGF